MASKFTQPESGRLTSHEKCQDPDNEEYKEADLGNTCSGTGDHAETEDPGDESDNKEN